jgi:hypothetical protein
MSVFATIVVANAKQSAAQAITSSDMFTTLFKKGLRKYWVSSGYFSQEHYDALVDSGLTFAIETDREVRPIAALSALGIIKIIEE